MADAVYAVCLVTGLILWDLSLVRYPLDFYVFNRHCTAVDQSYMPPNNFTLGLYALTFPIGVSATGVHHHRGRTGQGGNARDCVISGGTGDLGLVECCGVQRESRLARHGVEGARIAWQGCSEEREGAGRDRCSEAVEGRKKDDLDCSWDSAQQLSDL